MQLPMNPSKESKGLHFVKLRKVKIVLIITMSPLIPANVATSTG